MTKKRLVRNIFLIAGGFVLLLIILAEIFKEDIVKMALSKGAKTFDVPLSVGEVDFSLLYRFPYATIEFNDLMVLSHELSDSIKEPVDTLASISKLYASVDIVQLTKGNILVKKIEIEDVLAKYKVDSLGNSNFDFLLKASEQDTISTVEDTTKVQGVFTLDELTLENIELAYRDEKLSTAADLLITQLKMNGELEPSGFKASTNGNILIKSLQYDAYNLKGLSNSHIDFNITALNDSLSIQSLRLNTGSGMVELAGSMLQGDSAYVDVQIAGKQLDIAQNISILPQQMLKEFKIKSAGGELNFEASAKGYLSEYNLPQINASLMLKEGAVLYDIYPQIKNIQIDANVSNGYAATAQSLVLNLKKFYAETNRSRIDMAARIQKQEQLQYDVKAKLSTSLEELLPFVPDSTIRELKGKLSTNIKTAGVLPDSINADFIDYFLNRTQLSLALNNIYLKKDSIPEIKDLGGSLSYQPGHLSLKELKVNVPEYNATLSNGYFKGTFKGKLSDYEHLSFKVDSLLLETPSSAVIMKGNIAGLKQINYDVNTWVKLGLSEIKSMLPDSLANDMSGDIAMHLKSQGAFDIDSVADKALPLLFEQSSFTIGMDRVSLNMPDTIMNVQQLSGLMEYKNDSIWLNKITGNYLGLYFGADSTTISNVYTGAVQNNPKQMHVHGNFEAGDLDYAWIEAFMIDTIPKSEAEIQAEIQERQTTEPHVQRFTTKVNGKVKLRSFKYGDILAENIDSKFLAKIDDGYFVADQLSCNVFGGDVLASVKYQLADTAIFTDVLSFRADAKNVNMSRMLGELESFIDYEDFSKDKVKGTLSSKMDGRVVLKDYNVMYDSLMLSGDLLLEDGALVKVKPVMEIEKNAFLGISGLSNLRFSTLESSLFMYNNKVYIPQTLIKSTSFDASFLGMYGFDGLYAYHVRMFLGEILAGKSKYNLKKQKKDMGFVEESEDEAKRGRSAVYVVSSFDGKKEKAWFDNKNDREKMQNTVRVKQRILGFNFFPKKVKYETEVKD